MSRKPTGKEKRHRCEKCRRVLKDIYATLCGECVAASGAPLTERCAGCCQGLPAEQMTTRGGYPWCPTCEASGRTAVSWLYELFTRKGWRHG